MVDFLRFSLQSNALPVKCNQQRIILQNSSLQKFRGEGAAVYENILPILV